MKSLSINKWLFFGILLIATNAYAQNTGSISGNVLVEGGYPLIGANIIIKGTSVGTSTNAQGQFYITKLAPGDYTIVISAIGFLTKEENVNILAGETSTLNVISEENALELKNIIVTAEKREDELQKAPISISSVDAEKVAALQINNVNELGRITPNFRTYDDGGASFPLVSTRGITTIDATPIVGVYVDDVPLFNVSSFPSYFGDIDRIEVLKGPQGTLYGRNSIGGVINIISKIPTNLTKGYVSTGYGNFNQYNIEAGISTPLIKNKLFARLSGGITSRDGYIDNTFLNNSDLLGREAYTGNFRLTYVANNQWSFKLNSNFESRDVNAYAFVGGFGATSAIIDDLVANNTYEVTQNVNGLYETDILNNAFKASFTDDNIKIDAITAFQVTNLDRSNDDFDFSPLDIQQVVSDKSDFSTISQEIRISSNNESKLSWIGGLYLYRVSNESDRRTRNGADNAFNPQLPADAAAQYPYDQLASSEVKQTGFSVFGQGSYELTSELTATLGLRYELENSSLDVSNRFEKDGADFTYPLLGAVSANFDESTDFGSFSPKFNLAYQATDNSLVFVNVTRGYRPGGVNQFVLDETKASFDPEFSWNYEVGTKNKLWNNRAKLNVNAFYIEYKDQQLFNVLDLTTFSIGTENIGNSKSYGLELETEVVLIEGLNFIGNLGYLKTEFTDYTYTSFTTGMEINNEGNEQVMSPQWSGNTGLNYDFDINKNWKTNLALDYQFQSEVFFDPENNAKQDAYGLVNARFVVGSKLLEFSFWGQNLTDVTYLSYGYSVSASGIFTSYGLPRTYGASVSVKF